MKILGMLPAARGEYTLAAEQRRLNLIRSYTNAATQVDADYMPKAPGFIQWPGQGTGVQPPDAAQRAAEYSAQRAVQAEQEGYDAFCPFGTLDVGIAEARRLVKIPVVGQAEACFLFCALLGQPFASCSYVPGHEARIEAWAKLTGVGHLLVANTNIGFSNREYPERRPEVLENFARCAAEARAAGARVMGLVAMSICPTEFSARELTEAGGMPVLDALACQIAMAEWWHRTGLPPSLLRMPR